MFAISEVLQYSRFLTHPFWIAQEGDLPSPVRMRAHATMAASAPEHVARFFGPKNRRKNMRMYNNFGARKASIENRGLLQSYCATLRIRLQLDVSRF